MSLFPQKALRKGIKFECVASILDVQCPSKNVAGLKVEINGLDKEARRWLSGVDDLDWPGFSGGRGACTIRISQRDAHSALPTQFLLKIGIARGSVEDSLFVLPLIIGPFELTRGQVQLTGEEILSFHRQLSLPDQSNHDNGSSIIIRESPEIAIPGKIWDSALFATPGALTVLLKTITTKCPVVLDLSAGTGVCGIWMAVMLQNHFEQGKIILTDLEEALPVMRTNVELNQHLIHKDMSIDVQVLRWGNSQHTRTLPGVDVVIACDLIYEAELLPALVETLDAITTTGRTSVIIGYKQRGLSRQEKEHLWTTLATKFEIDKMPAVLGCMERECKSDTVGVELWRVWKKNAGTISS